MHYRLIKKIGLLVIYIATSFFASCSTSSSSSSEIQVSGNRFGVQLTRSSSQNDWVSVNGTQEWWFFAANVFRQISTNYVEPQFYGSDQACNGEGTGTWSILPAQTNDPNNLQRISISYDGTQNVSGLCRMTNRELDATSQPSGAVDLLDGSIVQRLSKIQSLQ